MSSFWERWSPHELVKSKGLVSVPPKNRRKNSGLGIFSSDFFSQLNNWLLRMSFFLVQNCWGVGRLLPQLVQLGVNTLALCRVPGSGKDAGPCPVTSHPDILEIDMIYWFYRS